jgi:hypothetical protein
MASPDTDPKRIARLLIRRKAITPSDVDRYLRYELKGFSSLSETRQHELYTGTCYLIEQATVRAEWLDDDLTLADELFEVLGGGGTIGTATAASQTAEYVKSRLQRAEAQVQYARRALKDLGDRVASPPPNTYAGLDLKYLGPQDESQAVLRMIENALVGIRRMGEDPS